MAYNGFIAEIPVGFGGLTGSKNQAKIRPDQLLEANNVSYFTGNLTKEGGAALYNAVPITGAPKVIGGWDWWPVDGVQRMIICTDAGEMRKDDGAGTFSTILKTGLTISGLTPHFVEGGKESAAFNRKLFCFSGLNPVQVLSGDGVTTSNLAFPPADWNGVSQPTFGLIHEGGRLWGGGNLNDPHRLYYSTSVNQEDFTNVTAGSISVYPGEGEKLVGGLAFKGLIIVFKFPRGIYMVDARDPSQTNWRAMPLTRAIGSVSAGAMVVIDDDVLFMDTGGNFQLASAVTAFGDMGSRNISSADNMITYVRDNVNRGQLSKTTAVYYSDKREAHFTMAGESAVSLNRRMVIDFNLPNLPRFRFSDRDVNHVIWLRKDIQNVLKPVFGTDGGFVYLMDQDTKSKGGQAYNASFQTAHMDLSWVDPKLAGKNKLGQFLELAVQPTGDWNLSVDVIWDNKVVQTVQYNMGGTGVRLGDFTLGTDFLGSDAILNRRVPICGEGRRISLAGRNNGNGEDFSVSHFYLHFKVGGENQKD